MRNFKVVVFLLVAVVLLQLVIAVLLVVALDFLPVQVLGVQPMVPQVVPNMTTVVKTVGRKQEGLAISVPFQLFLQLLRIHISE